MYAYWRGHVANFINADPRLIEAELQTRYARDGFVTQYTTQTRAWSSSLPLLQAQLRNVVSFCADSKGWLVLLEVPLYRLRRRIDLIIVGNSVVFVVEIKTGGSGADSAGHRQVEEYALDLRDFHGTSSGIAISPVLWVTDLEINPGCPRLVSKDVSEVAEIGAGDLANYLVKVDHESATFPTIDSGEWLAGRYRPVPTVIQAATAIFAGHQVDDIARADAPNLDITAKRISELIVKAQDEEFKALIFLTGTPGSGKTLVGLKVAHSAGLSDEREHDVVYLSGNSPLVSVIRESLARDEHRRTRTPLKETRSTVRAQIQHIIDFLKESLSENKVEAPHEKAIIFDEAQRAWDEAHGQKKFGRTASEPTLLLEIMDRHEGWGAIVCLVGSGQEINTGENGLQEWGLALKKLSQSQHRAWQVFGPPSLVSSKTLETPFGLGKLPPQLKFHADQDLELKVPMRSYRSPNVTDWVEEVIACNPKAAFALARNFSNYPVYLTRSLADARVWLIDKGRGERRYGLMASSEARRLRGEGLGVSLNATDGDKIAHWYLNEQGDIRSSYALEVTANQYTCQGLELDYVGLCWGGDMIQNNNGEWMYRRLSGNEWRQSKGDRARFIKNAYRVLMTRAREGFIIWVPTGNESDPTRDPVGLAMTADYLLRCGAKQYQV